MKKAFLVTACLSCLLVSVANAQPARYRGYGPAMPGKSPVMRAPAREKAVSEVEQAGAVLKAGLTKLLNFFQGSKPPTRAQIAVFLDKEIAPYFDFAYMTKWAAGSQYPRMTDKQRARMQAQLRTQFLTTMAQKLSGFNQQTVRYLKPRIQSPRQIELSIAIANPGSYPARLDFRLYKSGDSWKVYDVSANGSSALMYYRQYFRQKMQRPYQPRYKR